jgi:hypothetical protein
MKLQSRDAAATSVAAAAEASAAAASHKHWVAQHLPRHTAKTSVAATAAAAVVALQSFRQHDVMKWCTTALYFFTKATAAVLLAKLCFESSHATA